MGNRKPAVRSLVKKAARKYKEGKSQQAVDLARLAGEWAGLLELHGFGRSACGEMKLPAEIRVVYERAVLERLQSAAEAAEPAANG